MSHVKTRSTLKDTDVCQWMSRYLTKHIIHVLTMHVYQCYCGKVKVKVKVKLSLYRPRQATKAPGVWSFQNFQTISEQMWQGCQPHAPAAFTSQWRSLYSFLLRAESTPRPQCSRKNSRWKISKTVSGIDPIFGQFLSQLRTTYPRYCCDSLNKCS